MATPPTLVAETEPAVGWVSTATPKTTPSINVAAGDLVLVCAMSADPNTFGTPTNSGTAQTWSLVQSLNIASNSAMSLWQATMSVANAAMTISVTGTNVWSFEVMQFSNHNGIGASAKSSAATATPTLALTTTAANSAVCSFHADWSATDGTTRTWRTINGSPMTEDAYFRNTTNYAVYAGHRIDAGAAGSVTTGLSAPTTSGTYSNVAVEVKGSAVVATATPFKRRNRTAIRRAANW